ncbi:uncharacterized protein LOC107053900 isoform X2 [Gallus gallus]|uniref:uncharacterized protein LOC107053900 isoform X2 n=1 Tax=Gallus gallus TaxID=9031 RepID=UPI001AE1380D|nr:uncharacterized protein LOC107053900 isoform X2 [Gallus gallus]
MERGGVTRGRKGKSERGAGRGGAAVTQRAPPLTQPRGAPKVPEIAPRPDGIRAAGGDGRGARRAARHEVCPPLLPVHPSAPGSHFDEGIRGKLENTFSLRPESSAVINSVFNYEWHLNQA